MNKQLKLGAIAASVALLSLAAARHRAVMPPSAPIITGPTFGLGMLRNATPQRRLWQRFWLELLSNAGARCVSAPGGESA